MRRLFASGAVLLLSLGSAGAQQPPYEEKKLTLEVTGDQAMLIVQTLGAIGCRTVTELMTCQQAAELLRAIREQARAQGR